MTVFLLISIFLIACYAFFFGVLNYGFLLKKIEAKKLYPIVPITVLVPFRNEKENLEKLVNAFTVLNYNLNEVTFLFIDDHSTDSSFEVLNSALKKTTLRYKLIKQSLDKAGKKQAIETGVNATTDEYIVTTDADSLPSKNWLKHYAAAFEKGAEFIIGPVINNPSVAFISQLHSIEALMLSGVTMGSASLNKPILCSGANLGYRKSVFIALNPYENNRAIASGDDLFFLDEIIKTNRKISTLKTIDAVVYTKAHNNYKAVWKQAMRWSSKNKKLTQKTNLYFSALVFLTNLLVFPHLWLAIMGNQLSAALLLAKFVVDFSFLTSTALFYKQINRIFFTPFIYLLYPIHLIIIFVSSLFVSVQWKGRMIIKNEKQQ